jgi:hypothetical protein
MLKSFTNKGFAMIAQVTIKQVYGVNTVYPANDKAQLIARLAGTKTLTSETIETARALGFDFQVIQPTITI